MAASSPKAASDSDTLIGLVFSPRRETAEGVDKDALGLEVVAASAAGAAGDVDEGCVGCVCLGS